MSIIIKKELDPIYEIINLLYLDHHDEWKEETIKELCKYGIDGHSFFEKHYKIVEKYLKVFKKYKAATPQESYFFEERNDDYLLMILTFAIEHRKYMEGDKIPDLMDLRSTLAYYMTDVDDSPSMPEISELPKLPDEKSIIEFLDKADIDSGDKWYMLELLRTPDQWLMKIFDMVNANLPAYEKAVEAVSKPLAQLFEKSAAFDDSEFLKIAGTYTENIVVYPVLATPLLQAVLYSHGYQGLMTGYAEINSRHTDNSREALLRQLKALSDKSKLDILCELKKSSKYNSQLSEALNLSPSTMSHHMGALLSCGFVTVEKRDGRVYYCIQDSVIRKFLASLEQLVL